MPYRLLMFVRRQRRQRDKDEVNVISHIDPSGHLKLIGSLMDLFYERMYLGF